MKKTFNIIITSLALFASHSIMANGFRIKNTPINPACLALINQSEADMPFIYALNLNICQTANATFLGNNQTTAFKTKSGGVYSYHVIGETKQHLFVIATTLNSSGSGFFQDVILLRLKHKKIKRWDNQRHRFVNQHYLALIYVGSIGGGDRHTGSYKKLRIQGNHLIGMRDAINNRPIQATEPAKKVDIDLSGL